MKEHKTDTYSFESLKLDCGYEKLWCNVDWCVCCGTECHVERHVVRCGMR